MNGVFTNSTAIAAGDYNEIAADEGVYLGTGSHVSTGLGSIEDSDIKRLLWNMYNRLYQPLLKKDSTDSWSYPTAAWRNWNNTTANRVEFVQGLSEEKVYLYFGGVVAPTAATNLFCGIDLDGTAGNDADIKSPSPAVAGAIGISASIFHQYVSVGYHFLQLMEYGNAAGATFYGDAGFPDFYQSGCLGWIYG